MTVAELLAKIGFQVDDKPLDGLSHKLEGIQRRLEFLGAVEVIKGIAELGKRFGEFSEALGVNASAAGVTVESLQRLQFAAGLSGVNAEKVSGAMSFLSKSLYSARTGGKEAAESFSALGISPSQVSSFATTKEALAAVADGIAKIHDPVKRQAMTMQLLGRSAGDMTEFLAQGSKGWEALGDEAEAVGAVLSTDTVNILRDTGDSLNTLWQVARNFMATIAADFGPGIQAAVRAMLDFWKANRKVIELNIKKFVEDFMFALGYFYGVMSVVITRILEWAAAHQEVVDAAEKVIGVLVLVGGGIWTVHKAINAVKGIMSAVNLLMSPWFLIPALLALIGASVYSLYEEIFKGKDFKDTMLGQFFTSAIEFLHLTGPLKQLSKYMHGWDSSYDPDTIDFSKQQDMVGRSMDISQAEMASYTMNAPITVNIPAGTDPKEVAEKARLAIKEHVDGQYREAQRSLRNARIQ